MSENTMGNVDKSPHPVDVYVGMKVKQRRKSLGLSQTQLGENLGVTFQQVQKYERGHNRIGCSRLFYTSTALDVPVGFFFAGVEDILPDNIAYHDTSGSQSLLQMYSQIKNPIIKQQLIDLASALVKSDKSDD